MYPFGFSMPRASPGDNHFPPACFTTCSNALQEAQSQGKVPALCASGSTFMADYDDCTSCIVKDCFNSTDTTAGQYLRPQFGEYLDYCNITSTWMTVAVSVTVAGKLTALTTLTTHVTGLVQGATTRTTWTGSGLLVTATNNNASATALKTSAPTPSPRAEQKNVTWVAGPVVGSLAGCAVLVLTVFLTYRYRRRKIKSQPDESTDKPQNHFDQTAWPLPQELDAAQKRHELPADHYYPSGIPSELAAQNPGGTIWRSELDSNEPGQRHAW
ncbi:putative Mid2 domain-containing protein [Seiridium cardinale]|uniref:Mid2 domain-containing protein n=1 Tax=Seiridium cardinale TaxID=138064 RepID=A0ABR2Y888_9PEZI